GVATVSNAAATRGLVSSVAQGMTTVSATLMGVSGSTLLTVSAAALTSINIMPAGATWPKGTSLQLTASGVFSDNSTQDVTQQVTWTTNPTGIAAVSNAAGSHGLAVGAAVGTTTVTAAIGAVSAQSTL